MSTSHHQIFKEISDDIKVIKNSQDNVLKKIKEIERDIVKLTMIEEKVKRGEDVSSKTDGWFWATFS
jgi:hypothetical protein